MCSRTSISRSLALIVALAACKGGNQQAEPANPGSATAKPAAEAAVAKSAVDAGAIAHKIVDAQVAAIQGNKDGDLVASFTKDAVVLTGSPHEAADGELIPMLAQLTPHDQLKDVKVARVVAGGNDEAVWLFAELSITKHNSEPGEKETDATSLVRATELATAASGWKVVTAAFGEPNDPVHSGGAFPMIDTTAAGPLAQLLAAPKLSDDPNAVVITGKDAAVGPDAAKALATWSAHHAVVDGAVREIREAKWGVVQANLSWKDGDGPPFRASAQLIALPKTDGSWEIVALHLFKV